MQECKDIKRLLHAYIDDDVSDAERIAVEKHVLACDKCSVELEELKRMKKLLLDLEEVEEPPWFAGRVMAHVREEATAKKSLFRKLFYPLHVKIPVEVLAVCIICVLSLYTYQAVNREEQAVQSMSGTSPVIPGKQEKQKKYTEPVAPEAERKYEPPRKMLPVPDKTKETPSLQDNTPGKEEIAKDKNSQSVYRYPPQPAPGIAREETKGAISVAKEREGSLKKDEAGVSPEAPAPAAIQPDRARRFKAAMESEDVSLDTGRKTMVSPEAEALKIMVRVRDDESIAGEEINKTLSRMGGRGIVQRRVEKGLLITVRLPGEKFGGLINELKKIGDCEAGKPFPVRNGEYIAVSITVTLQN